MALVCASFTACATPLVRPPEPSPVAHPVALSAPLSEFGKTRAPVRHVIVGCEPCSIYSLDVNAQRAAYPVATAGGRVTFTAALKPGDKVSLMLYRRRACVR